MSQQARQVVFVRCRFGPGDFPTDRKFTIDGFDRSTADENYCFALDRKTRIGDMDLSRKKSSPGYVLGLIVGYTQNDLFRVECPDGDIYELRADQFVSKSA